MIAHLHGTVAGISPDGAIIDVGGVGMRVLCTPGTLAALTLGERAQLATSLSVKEDSLTLYGFATDDERNVFELLQSAKGVGASLALAILAVHTPEALRRAVATEDVNALTLVPRIGKKGAQQILLDMKDRLGPPGDAGTALPGSRAGQQRAPSWRDQVQSGLVNLGWPVRDADQAIAALEEDGTIVTGEPVDIAVALRAALRKLSTR
ncbi:MAG TPA: Holliday junction branch migration protein RuvA [Streptosporangiaceae bacterium]|nr:Holliday junction branch migration protein RuvA [Streptosporangiaceae bacterium]